MRQGQDCLYYASGDGHIEIVQLLIDAGGNVNVKSK